MNAPYDGDRDPAGRLPHSSEQPPAPQPDPYLQGTYAYDPYQQQDPAQWQQQGGYPQGPYPEDAAAQYGGQGAPAPGQVPPGQGEDPFAHLFRDQQQYPQQQQQQPYPPQDYQQAGYQQQYPQQGYDPRTHYQQGGGYQDGYGGQHGYGQGGHGQGGHGGYPAQQPPVQPQPQQSYGYPAGYPHMPSPNETTGFSIPVFQDPGYGQEIYQSQSYGDPRYADQQYVDPRYADPRYGYPYQQPYQEPYEQPYQDPQQQPYPPQGQGQVQQGQPQQGAPVGAGAPRRAPVAAGAAAAAGAGSAAAPAAAATAAPAATGKAGGILKSSALMAAGTLVSRLTGFVRTLVIAGAIGVATLGDSYTVANTLPTMIYILTIGGGLNSVFVPQLVRSMKDDEDGGSAYANRLLTVVMVVLGAIVMVTVLGAPVLIRLMSAKIADNPDTYDVAITFARYCLPTIFFMGIHVVMGQVLNARGKFGAMMWTPVLNNVVVIFTFGMFIWVYGSYSTTRMDATTISPEGVRLLGIGTLLGLVVQSLAMLPYLRDAGFRFRPRFDWRGHGLGKAARLAKWTFFFVLANQAGLIVVTQLATWAGANADKSGFQGTGITAYNNALLIWQMPQAIITVSVMAAVLPRISRAAADGDITAVRDDISYGLRTSAVAIVPAAFAFLALGIPMCTLLYASTSGGSARNIGFVLMAFGGGLIPYSVQYVILRGFYAFEDTRTPFYNTVVVAAVNAAASAFCFLILPSRWAVVGMAFSYGLAYAVGVGVAVKRLRKRLNGDLDGRRVVRTYARLVGACVPAAALAGLAVYVISEKLGGGVTGSLASLVVGGVLLGGVFLVIAKRMRIQELNGMIGMVRGRLGR
ncbi:murein biosynthesis integral membrane protein MurJ [Actinacidiphila epipremni]|uniref:Murein biosynthesis integral membrane protein MurJ n=1 Tax=Actinacidiphila epipremni TaxID=2053013 RepID=A0ABX0ZGQ0_9ACTN|nr:murein biosynthesis integral membrane protein MurJ [Actinacidiphila epipremni]NJP42993.1 murein biosynthesis integral membrane protein MurJ [Actinacidiphila epipremni]